MVVRSSFVTNSSSSSFVALEIDSQEVADILQEFADELEDIFECGNIDFDGSRVSIFMDDASAECPETPEDIVHAIAGMFSWNYYEDYQYSKEDEEELDMSEYSELVQRLIECKDEIMANLKAFKMSNGGQGWQGDDDSRYNQDWWEADTLESIKVSIAVEKNCEIDEVTDEDFDEYVGDKVSSEEDIYEYNPETKEFTHTRTTELL